MIRRSQGAEPRTDEARVIEERPRVTAREATEPGSVDDVRRPLEPTPEDRLATAMSEVSTAAGPGSVVGFIAGTRPERVASDQPVDGPALESLSCRIAAMPDGEMTLATEGLDDGWRGARYALDAGRVAFVVVPAASLGEIERVRLSALALDLA